MTWQDVRNEIIFSQLALNKISLVPAWYGLYIRSASIILVLESKLLII
jgi:hypothetical protein